MKAKDLKLLSKEELIQIIQSDKQWERRAFYKTLDIVGKRIDEIISAQEKCDLTTRAGWDEYNKLEKEYQKWSNIHANL